MRRGFFAPPARGRVPCRSLAWLCPRVAGWCRACFKVGETHFRASCGEACSKSGDVPSRVQLYGIATFFESSARLPRTESSATDDALIPPARCGRQTGAWLLSPAPYRSHDGCDEDGVPTLGFRNVTRPRGNDSDTLTGATRGATPSPLSAGKPRSGQDRRPSCRLANSNRRWGAIDGIPTMSCYLGCLQAAAALISAMGGKRRWGPGAGMQGVRSLTCQSGGATHGWPLSENWALLYFLLEGNDARGPTCLGNARVGRGSRVEVTRTRLSAAAGCL